LVYNLTIRRIDELGQVKASVGWVGF